MRFEKIQGLGNDYLFFDNTEDQLKDADVPALSRKLSDRNFGAGSDGIITVNKPSEGTDADYMMRIYNADGSEAEMCGNGVRGFMRYLLRHGMIEGNTAKVETKAGIKIIEYADNMFSVDMGEPTLEPKKVPVNLEGDKIIDHAQKFGDKELNITCVSMGNPHCIIFVDDVDNFDVHGIGRMIETDPIFPNRTNVEFLQVISPTELKMRVWERGSGETLACGTGACASLVAAVLNKKSERKATLHLLGGDLEIEWRTDNHINMRGPAEYVFSGEVKE